MTDEITKQITAFLESDTDKILILKGKWGIGKTYFWQQFINNHIHEYHSTFQTYSYVSLFGINSLETFQETIITNSLAIKKPIPKDSFIQWCIEEKEWWSSRLPGKIYRKLISIYQKIITSSHGRHALRIHPLLNKLPISLRKIDSPLNNFLYNQIINNNITCIDDIERSNLSITTLMGYADKLTQKKNCKIIFIFNEDELEPNQKTIFNQYREKIVDVELTYSPTLEDQLKIVFGDDLLEKYPIIREVINSKSGQGFYIKNIRVLAKIKSIINEFESLEYKSIPIPIVNNFITHTILLSYCYYEANSKDMIPFTLIKNHELKIEFVPNLSLDEGNELYNTDFYSKLVEIRNNLSIPSPSEFSQFIINKLEHGYWDNKLLNTIIQNWISNIHWKNENQKIMNLATSAWDLYYNSMNNHENEISSIFQKIISTQQNYPYLDSIDFMTLLNYTLHFERISKASQPRDYYIYIKQYINSSTNCAIEFKENRFHILEGLRVRQINPQLINFFKRSMRNLTGSKQYSNYSIEQIAIKLLDQDQKLTSREKRILRNTSEKEFFNWIKNKNNDPDLYYKIKNMLNYYELQPMQPMREALIKISKETELNKDRIQKFLTLPIN